MCAKRCFGILHAVRVHPELTPWTTFSGAFGPDYMKLLQLHYAGQQAAKVSEHPL
jgi:hypothetical protein